MLYFVQHNVQRSYEDSCMTHCSTFRALLSNVVFWATQHSTFDHLKYYFLGKNIVYSNFAWRSNIQHIVYFVFSNSLTFLRDWEDLEVHVGLCRAVWLVRGTCALFVTVKLSALQIRGEIDQLYFIFLYVNIYYVGPLESYRVAILTNILNIGVCEKSYE